VATKEDIVRATSNADEDADGRNDIERIAASVPVPVPLVFLTSNMRLQASLTKAMSYVDSTCNYITTLKRNYFLCINWLRENVDGFKMQGDLRVAWKRFQNREAAALKKRDFLLVTLEKWTSISLAKIMVGVDGKIRKVRERQAKGRKAAGSRVKKAVKVSAESVAMSIDDLHSAYTEVGDFLQVLIGTSFAVKLRYQEIQLALLSGKATFDNSKKGAVAKQASKVKHEVGDMLPYASLLGLASLYIHYIYVSGPEEIDRVKKSIVAFERDKKKQAEVAAKDAKRAHLAGMHKVGPRFRVLRPWEIEERNERLGYDPQERADEAAKLAAEIKQREKEEAEARAEALRIRAEEEAGGAGADSEMEDEDTDEEDEESEEEEKELNGRKVVRERTRFLVPKQEMQKKYGDLFEEDLSADKLGTKNGIVMFSRSNRNHVVTTIPFHLEMPSDDYSRKVPVDILLEVEEERADSLQPLSRLDCIRPFARLQERIRHKKAMNKYIREEALGM